MATSTKTELWNKAGRFFTVTVVLCFFLPFFGISCQGMEIVKFSGADMVFGCKPGGMITEAEKEASKLGGEGKVKSEIPNVERKPLAIIAFAAAIGATALAWAMRGKRVALIPTFVLALVGTGAMVGLYVTISSELEDTAKEGPGGMKKQPEPDPDMPSMELEPPDELKNIDIDAGARFGFWLTSLGFLAIAGITGLALREKDPPPPPAAPPA